MRERPHVNSLFGISKCITLRKVILLRMVIDESYSVDVDSVLSARVRRHSSMYSKTDRFVIEDGVEVVSSENWRSLHFCIQMKT
jgi:hypothetical protein